jgi:hypothetical protein
MFARLMTVSLAAAAFLAAAAPARAQYLEIDSFEVSPFVGVRLGGTFEILPDAPRPIDATLKDAQSYGFSAGIRFDELSLVEFRWTQSTTTLRFDAPFVRLGPAIGDVTFNQFHVDFTREFIIPEIKGLRSFLTGSLGLTHMGASGDAFTRFSFGFGGGLKQFIGSKLAIRAEGQWLPIWISPEVSGFACNSVSGGCLLLLDGRLTSQFQFSVGPVVRF